MKVFQILVFFTGIVLIKSQETKVNACSKDVMLPKVALFNKANSVCSQSPCEVTPGTTLILEVNFTSPCYLEHIMPKARAHVMDTTIDYPLTQKDACAGLKNTMCPLVTDEFISYSISLDLLSFLPAISLGIEFSIEDADTDNEEVLCFQLGLIVTPK